MPKIHRQPTAKEHWEQFIEALEAEAAALDTKLARAKAVYAAIGDAELADELAKSFRLKAEEMRPAGLGVKKKTATKKTAKKKRGFGKLTYYGKIRRFFEKRENEWAFRSEIEDATGISADAIRQVIYNSHPSKFERRPGPNGSRLKQFQLKEAP